MRISPNDSKNYQSFTLDNGLRVVLVESADAHKSACSLVVNTGSFDDPTDRPGFAHFIEHLLFNGNEHFPEPNAINNFVAQHGGSCNAWTGTEHSNYFFDIRPARFAQGLKYFAHLFVNPLFSDEALTQEQAAIHSEYKLKLKDDSRRIQQVHKETCNLRHPFHKFSVGNRHTLSDLPNRPVREELLEFWRAHYQAQFMTLAIVTSLPSAEIKPVIQEYFSQLPTLDPSQTKKQIDEPLYGPGDLGVFIQIRPVKELHKLNVSFAMPGIDHLYTTKMVSFVAHLIGYEGAGSLYETLKLKGFANAMSAGHGVSGSNFKDFNVSFELTELGEENLDAILQDLFCYLNFLRAQSPGDYLYDEQKKLTEISFLYQEDIKPIKLANHVALNMQYYPEEDYLAGDYRMDGLDEAVWKQIFNCFFAENMRVVLVSQNIETSKQAHWYHTPYEVTPMPEELMQILNAQPAQASFKLPGPNPYLSKDVELEPMDFNSSAPINIDDGAGWQCWFKQDVSFRVPKGNIYLGLDLPHAQSSSRAQAMIRLFCDLLLDDVAEQHYQAEMAGLHYNLYAHNAGVTLYTSGLSNSQPDLLLNLLENILNIQFETNRFNEIKRLLVKHWRNSEANKPISQLFSLLSSQLVPASICPAELADELETVTFDEFVQFRQTVFTELYAESLIYGNWNTSQAIAINGQIKHALSGAKLVKEIPRDVVSLTNQGIQKLSKQIQHNDKAAVLYVQGLTQDLGNENDFAEKAMFILISQILAPFSFSYLRTEHQLGYLAGSGYMPMSSTPGVALYVQSHDHDSEVLLQHLTDCLQKFSIELVNMSEDEFNHHKKAVIHQYQEQPTNLNQKCQQLWVCIGNKDYGFDHKQQIVAELQSMTLDQVLRWSNGTFSRNSYDGMALLSK